MIEYDIAVCLLFNRASHRLGVKPFFIAVSRLGDGIFWYVLILSLPALFGWQAVKTSIHMAAVGLVALGVYLPTKRLVERPRPCLSHQQVVLCTAPLDRYSFPSGHIMHAVSFTTVAIAYYPAFAYLLVPFTASIALSRLILGLHYPTDVVAGAAIGWTIAKLSLLFARV